MITSSNPNPSVDRGARRRLGLLLGALAIVAAACGGGASTSPNATPSDGAGTPGASATPGAPSPTPAEPVELTVGLGYVPSVQFAQFYLAEQDGYYRDAGLEVTFLNRIDPELVTLVGQGAVDVGVADGTSVITAVSQGIPVRYIFTVYADFPSIVFARASSGISTTTDLAGRKVGIPGRFGSSWIQLQVLLDGVGLTPDDVEIVPFPDFGQRAALEQGVIDVATGFVNNEPVRLEFAGTPTVVLALPDGDQLPGNGLIAGQAILDSPKAEAIRAFVAATRRATEEIVADPEKGLEAAIARIPELESEREIQLEIMKATIATWQNDHTAANGIGAIDAAAWERSIDVMSGLPDSPVARVVTAAECIDTTFAAE